MNPKDYKGRTVIHVATDTMFVVNGGGKNKKTGNWYLKDDRGTTYSLDECELFAVEFSVLKSVVDPNLSESFSKLQSVQTLDNLVDLRTEIGADRVRAAWIELEKDPIEAAVVALHYCETWQQFVDMTGFYGVSREISQEKNAIFRKRIEEKGLNGLVNDLYSKREVA